MHGNSTSGLVAAHLDRVRGHYDTCPRISPMAHKYREILARYYNLLIPRSASVLEVGCGAGDLLSRLHARQKAGIDISEAQIKLAREKLPDSKFYVQSG